MHFDGKFVTVPLRNSLDILKNHLGANYDQAKRMIRDMDIMWMSESDSHTGQTLLGHSRPCYFNYCYYYYYVYAYTVCICW